MNQGKALTVNETDEVIKLFLRADDPANSNQTNKMSRNEAVRFIIFARDQNIGLADALEVYAECLEKRGLSNKTINKIISLVRKRIKRAFELHRDHLDMAKLYAFEKIINGVKRKKVADHDRAVNKDKLLSQEEVERLVSGLRSRECDGIVTSPKKIALVIEVLNHTGLRISESLEIRQDALKRPRGADFYEVKIRGKGDKERTVMIGVELVKRVKGEFGGDKYLFEHSNGKIYGSSYVSHQIAKAGRIILKKHISAHSLRHSFATRKLREGKTLKAVSRYLGHSSTAITADLYIHDDLGWEDLKK